MKKLLFASAFLFFVHQAFCQIVPSSCEAQDSIRALYADDADLITFQYIYDQEKAYKDSIELPADISNQFIDALIAVRNATTLETADQITNQYNIHAFPYIVLNEFYISADSSASWMDKVQNGNFPTGNIQLDALMLQYNLSVNNYSDQFGFSPYHSFNLVSTENYNAPEFVKLFQDIENVQFAETSFIIGDGNNITGSIHENYTSIIYSIGWGDCPAGCIHRKFWEFKIYEDCSVEFIACYGDVINSAENSYFNKLKIYPLPFSNSITIETELKECQFEIFNLQGLKIKEGFVLNKSILDLNTLASGLYLLKLTYDKTIYTKLISK